MTFLNRKHLFANCYWRKTLMTMKLLTLLLISGLMQVHASVFSQGTFNLRESNISVKELFRKIEKQSQYSIFFRQDQVDLSRKVNVDLQNADIFSVMGQALKDQPLFFELIDNTIVIKEKTSAQQKNVSGKVTDSNGEPLPGVTIKIKGSDTGTITGPEGNFVINLPTGNETLVISYLGFKDQEVAVNGRASLSISLEESTSSLDEVVVIGYGTVKKRDLTGSVASVKAEDIALSPVSNPVEALQGRVAGLDIQRSSGQAGEAPSILLRGNRSLTAGQEPLYIIDNIPGGDISSLNPNDIESIEVLKDASSTAIYGSAGANGVIIVTTKKAKAGKVQIDVNSYYGVNGFAQYPKPLMGDAWLQYRKDAYFAKNGTETDDLSDLGLSQNVINAIDSGKWVDWVDESLKTGSQQNHHISIRGGSEKTQGYLSLGYIGEEGIYPNDDMKAFNTRTGADIKLNNIVKAGVQLTLNWRDDNSTNSRVNKSYGIEPVGTPYLQDGSINLYPVGGSSVSPIANYAPGVLINNSKDLFISANPYVELTPIENLSIRSNFGARYTNSRTGFFQNERSYNLAAEARNTKEASYETGLSYSYVWENIVNYSFTLRKDHEFTVTGITSWWDNRSESSSIYGQGLDYDDFIYYNLGAASNITDHSSAYRGSKKLSFAGRINYNYKGKYILTISNRWDGASQLVDKWSSFPSVAGAWRISDENFMSNTKNWLNNLKLRAGYGVTGNANIDPYVSTTEVVSKPGTNLSLGGSSTLPIYILKSSLGNKQLTWETSYGTNIGLDATVFNSRIDLSADWYFNRTEGVLWDRKLPFSSGGFDAKNPYTIYSNIANTENRGFELALTSHNIQLEDFKWSSNLTFSRYREKLTGIDLGDGITADDLVSEGLFINQPINTIYGYKKIGIWQSGEETEAALYGAKPGDIKLQTVEQFDENGVSDGGVHVYSADDRMILGHTNPDWSLGLQNSFTYKNFDLTVFMTMRYGQTVESDILGFYNTVSQPAFYNYWTPSNPTNDYPSPIQDGGGINKTYQSALNIVDGSYWKIKNITLAYRVPVKAVEKLGFSRIRIYGTAYNPFIFAKSHLLEEVDPETGGTDQFPLYKQVVFGVNLSF